MNESDAHWLYPRQQSTLRDRGVGFATGGGLCYQSSTYARHREPRLSRLRNPLLATVMPVFGYFGHVTIGTLIGLGLLGLGSFYKNSRIRLIGIVILIAVLAALGIAEAFKYIVQPSTQQLPLTYGLPSSQAAAAFALASTLSVAFPGFAPIFFALAILAGIARLYSRGQYFWNVLGGSALGLAIGLTLALKLVPRAEALDRYAVGFFGWLGTGALTLVALIFFYWSESNMAAHLIPILRPNLHRRPKLISARRRQGQLCATAGRPMSPGRAANDP